MSTPPAVTYLTNPAGLGENGARWLAPALEVSDGVNFTLRYDGALPGGQSHHQRQAKNVLRAAFHKQLADLCATHWELRVALGNKLPLGIRKGEQIQVMGGMPDGLFRVDCGGYEFVPLFSQTRPALIKVRVEIYRRKWLGGIFNPGGDLDNQAKVVLDGLRMPQDDSEAKGLDLPAKSRCYCLLENDALITVATFESRQSLLTDLPLDHASLLVHVEATWTRLL